MSTEHMREKMPNWKSSPKGLWAMRKCSGTYWWLTIILDVPSNPCSNLYFCLMFKSGLECDVLGNSSSSAGCCQVGASECRIVANCSHSLQRGNVLTSDKLELMHSSIVTRGDWRNMETWQAISFIQITRFTTDPIQSYKERELELCWHL